LPWHKDGITLLGCPIGSEEYVRTCLERVYDGIARRSDQLSVIDDGLIHLQLHKFCINPMLQYFLRTTSPALTLEFAQRVDLLIWQAILDFSHMPLEERTDEALQAVFRDAQCQIALPISQGGFGITPNECVATPAFYTAVSHALRLAAAIEFAPIRDYMRSLAFLQHPLYVAYAQAREDLLAWGAVEPDSPEAQSQTSNDQLRDDSRWQAPAAEQHSRKPRPPVLPKLDDVLYHSVFTSVKDWSY